MYSSDLEELQKDTFKVILILTGALSIVLFYGTVGITYVITNDTTFYWWLPCLLLFIICYTSYHLQQRVNFRLATYVFISGLILTVDSFILWPFIEFSRSAVYLLLLVVAIAGLLISPQAAAKTAVIAVVTTLALVILVEGEIWESVATLAMPLSLTCGMAAVSWVSSEHLMTTLQWALNSEARTQERSQELFKSQQELQKAYTLLETTNIRLKQAEAAATQANTFKTRFITNLSHELRTPLSAIINFSFILSKDRHGQVTPEQRDYLNRIHDSGNLLLEIVNDLLDLAKIEAGQMELFREPVDLASLTAGVVTTASGLVADKPVELRQEIPPNLPEVFGDSTRIRQILLNLIGNAVKYTQEGHITIWMSQANKRFVHVSIIDTGIGIRPQDFERIFEEFQQTEEALTLRKVGTGLGLPICKKFVELHGGKLWVESEFGQGATFHFTLPISKKTEPTATKPDQQTNIVSDRIINS